MKGILKSTAIITAITLVAGLLLGAVHTITKEPIAKQKELEKTEACKAVFSEADSFELLSGHDAALRAKLREDGFPVQIVDEVMEAKDGAGAPLGYVLTITTGEGYGGGITFAMGVKEDGTVNGISFLFISETAGLGMKADTEEFKEQFANKNVTSFSYTKTGASADGEIDALSGATVTTNAITNAVNAGLAAVEYLRGGNE